MHIRKYLWGNNKPKCDVRNYQGCMVNTSFVGSIPENIKLIIKLGNNRLCLYTPIGD